LGIEVGFCAVSNTLPNIVIGAGDAAVRRERPLPAVDGVVFGARLEGRVNAHLDLKGAVRIDAARKEVDKGDDERGGIEAFVSAHLGDNHGQVEAPHVPHLNLSQVGDAGGGALKGDIAAKGPANGGRLALPASEGDCNLALRVANGAVRRDALHGRLNGATKVENVAAQKIFHGETDAINEHNLAAIKRAPIAVPEKKGGVPRKEHVGVHDVARLVVRPESAFFAFKHVQKLKVRGENGISAQVQVNNIVNLGLNRGGNKGIGTPTQNNGAHTLHNLHLNAKVHPNGAAIWRGTNRVGRVFDELPKIPERTLAVGRKFNEGGFKDKPYKATRNNTTITLRHEDN